MPFVLLTDLSTMLLLSQIVAFFKGVLSFSINKRGFLLSGDIELSLVFFSVLGNLPFGESTFTFELELQRFISKKLKYFYIIF